MKWCRGIPLDLQREQIYDKPRKEQGLVEVLFAQFGTYLNTAGYQTQCGQIEENQQVKQGEVPEEWQAEPHKLSQKDVDARCAFKSSGFAQGVLARSLRYFEIMRFCRCSAG